MDVEVLNEALQGATKNGLAARVAAAEEGLPVKPAADVLEAARAHLHEPVRRAI